MGIANQTDAGMCPEVFALGPAGLAAALAKPTPFRRSTQPGAPCPSGPFIADALADEKAGFREGLIVGIALPLTAFLAFDPGLGVSLEPFRWQL